MLHGGDLLKVDTVFERVNIKLLRSDIVFVYPVNI